MTQSDSVSRMATPSNWVLLVRLFGWCMLAILFAFLINSILSVSFGYGSIWDPAGGSKVLAQMIVVALPVLLACFYVLQDKQRALRYDAALITRFNTWIIRGCFWAIVLVGLADMAISFLRVEGLLEYVVSDDMSRKLGRPQYRGAYIHGPLIAAGFVLALFTRTIGFHWLALLIVVAELTIVITRFLFSYEQAFMGDLVRLWYAALFLFASAYTLLEEGHVRVDVLYSGFASRTKGLVNAWGALLLGISLCWTILIIGMKGKASIIYGPVANFEVSQSGFGMYTKYLMAAFLGIFAVTMLIQFVSQMLESYADYRDDPGGRVKEEEDAIPSH